MDITELNNKLELLYKGGLSGKEGEPLSKESKSCVLSTNSRHLFCEKENFPKRVSTFALTCLSYNNDTVGNDNLKNKINDSLNDCEQCILNHYSERCELFYYLCNILKMPYQKVEFFFKDIDSWRARELISLPNLLNYNSSQLPTNEKLKLENNDVIVLSSDDEDEIQIIDPIPYSTSETNGLNKEQSFFISEILMNPNLLTIEPKCGIFLNEITSAFPLCIKTMNLVKENGLLPGIVAEHFAQDELDHWSTLIIQEAVNSNIKLSFKNSSALIPLIFELISQGLKKETNQISKERYYYKIAPILQILGTDVLTDFFKPKHFASINRGFSDYNFFLAQLVLDLNYVNDNSKSLPYLFRIIKIVFTLFDQNIWSLFLAEFKVEHFVMVLKNPLSKNNLKSLMISSQERLDVNLFDPLPHLSDFIEWVNPFYKSLKVSLNMLLFSRNYVNFVLKFVDEDNELQNIPKGLLTCSGCIFLNKLLAVNGEKEPTGVSNKVRYLEDKLNDVIPYRGVMNKQSFLQTLVNYSLLCSHTINSNNSTIIASISEPIFNLLFTCLQIDLNVLILSITKLQIDQKSIRVEDIKEINPAVYDSIITNLNFYSFNDSQKLIFSKKFFCHLRDLYLVINLSNYTTLIKEKSDKINRNVSLFTNKIAGILDKIESDDYGFISKAFSKNEDVLHGFWSCIFSDNKLIYSKTVGILYSCFDEEDRISNFHKLLSLDFKGNLNIITSILDNLCEKKLFEPCLAGINVLEDLIDAIVVLIKMEFAKANEDIISEDLMKDLFKFWNVFWKFIKTLYETAYSWAHILKIDILLEFCKNSMDLHKLAVESVVWFEKILKDKTKYDLIAPILDVLIVSPSWLKLNDEPLVDQCINLLVYILDMANKNWDRKVAKIIVYEIFSVANKKDPETGKIKKTLTTDEQRKKLIDSLYEVDSEYVSKLSKKLLKFSTFDPKSREDADVKIISSSKIVNSRTDDSISYALKGSKLATKTNPASFSKLSGLSNYKSTLSSKDKAEEQLRMKRASNGRVIHPASNNVFNDFSKHKDDKSSSEEEEDDEDVAEIKAMFGISKSSVNQNVKKKEKHGITMVDEFGNEITKSAKQKIEKKLSLEEMQKIEKGKMEKRLKVNIDPFYQEILKWDFRCADEYPYSNFSYQKTKLNYTDVFDYQKTMGPLLLLETWQQLIRSKQLESQKVISIDVTNRITVGSFFIVFATVPTSLWEQCNFTEADICGLGCNNSSTNRLDAPQSSKQFSLLDVVNYCKIDEVKNTRGDLKEISIKISLTSDIAGFASPGSFLFLTKISSVATSEREYTTLYGLQDYNLLDELLFSTIKSPLTSNMFDLKNTISRYNVNDSQAAAIVNATASKGISLIQGPPGTGKSKTIVSMMKYYFEHNNINFEEMPTNKKRILLCAPSNAAIDELLLRLSTDTKLNLVRIGRKEAVNIKVQHLVLNEIIEKKLKKPELISIDGNKYKEELNKRNAIKEKIEIIKSKGMDSDSIKSLDALRAELTMCNDTLNVMRKERDSVRETNNVFRRRSEFEKKNLIQKVLSEADVVCCTLSGAAQNQLQSLGIYFPTVVVDEACQCTELSSLVPLRYGAKQLIMVGDPNQLPPTVISNVAADANYDESLFSRLIQGNSPYLLNVQYRMHPEISKFPSKQFYEGKLMDGPNMEKLNEKQWHSNPLFRPYVFYSVTDGFEEKSSSLSLSNTKEAEFALQLVDTLLKSFPKTSFKNQIGIVSPYKEQVRLLRRLFEMRFGSLINQTVAIETVDSFQGQEKTIMIFSCVRSSDTSSSIGFLRDFRRLNVALTRGKSNMLIIGNSNMLRKDKLWGNLIRDAEGRNIMIEAGPQIFKQNEKFVGDDNDAYHVKPLQQNEIIGKKRRIENAPKNQPLKKVKLTESNDFNRTVSKDISNLPAAKKKQKLETKKVSLNTKENDNFAINPKVDGNKSFGKIDDSRKTSINSKIFEKPIALAKKDEIPGIYIHDASSSQQPSVHKTISSEIKPKAGIKSILKTKPLDQRTKTNKKVNFIDKPTINLYKKKHYEDQVFGPVYTDSSDVNVDPYVGTDEFSHFDRVRIDGGAKQIKSSKKNVLDINKYKKAKEKLPNKNNEAEDEDDYEIPQTRKQDPSVIENRIQHQKEEEEDDDDAYVPFAKKVELNESEMKTSDNEEDDYDLSVVKPAIKNNTTTLHDRSNKKVSKLASKKLVKTQKLSSPFITDPYKMMKMKIKKNKK